MKAKVKIWTSDGETAQGFPVKLILSHNRKTRRKTIFYSPAEDWDITKELPKPSHYDFEDLYARTLNIKAKAVKMEFQELEDFEKAFDYLLDIKKKLILSFYDWADKRIEYMEKQNRKGNAEAYLFSKIELEKYRPNLSFSDFTPTLLEGFKAYKKAQGIKNTTIKKYLVELRAMYNSAVKAGITQDTKPFKGLFQDLPIKKRRLKNRYLPEDEIIKLEKAELSPSYQRAVDFSLLQFYLCGVDLVDLYYLKAEDIVKDRVFFRRRKLGDRGYEFDVYLPQKARLIINKYKAEEGEFLFPWSKDYTSYKTFRNNHNRNLKILQKRLNIVLTPKNDNLTTKVMRHTFATLGKFARIEEDLLRELMGHERNEIDTVYKDKYPEAERDAAQLKVINEKAVIKKTKRTVKRKAKVKRSV